MILAILAAATGDCQAELKGHSNQVNSAVFSPDGRHIVSASWDYTARIWNTATGDCQAKLKGHSNVVISAVFSPDGRHIVSVSSDHTTRIWNIATSDCQAELKDHSTSSTLLSFLHIVFFSAMVLLAKFIPYSSHFSLTNTKIL